MYLPYNFHLSIAVDRAGKYQINIRLSNQHNDKSV